MYISIYIYMYHHQGGSEMIEGVEILEIRETMAEAGR
jgi:hypothetical protein